MFFWFVAGSILVIWFVFTDPHFDYRLLPLGALGPAWLSVGSGRAGISQSLVMSVALLGLVMVATRRSTKRRTFWMGLPLGALLGLTLNGSWLHAEVFFWPFFGWRIPDIENPMLARGWWNLALEALGAIGCWWIWTRARLGRAEQRRQFRSSGNLDLPER